MDLSADKIIGTYLYDKDRTILYKLCDSSHLWSQQVSIMATFYSIRKGQFGDTCRFAEKLLTHKHDLIHKTVGWMLCEAAREAKRPKSDS